MRRGKPPARAGPQRQGELSRGKRGGASVRALFFVSEAKAPPRGNLAAGRRRRKGKRSDGSRRKNGGAGEGRGANGTDVKTAARAKGEGGATGKSVKMAAQVQGEGQAGAAQDGSRDRIFRAVRGTKDTGNLLVSKHLLQVRANFTKLLQKMQNSETSFCYSNDAGGKARPPHGRRQRHSLLINFFLRYPPRSCAAGIVFGTEERHKTVQGQGEEGERVFGAGIFCAEKGKTVKSRQIF